MFVTPRAEDFSARGSKEKFPWNQNSITANTFELELLFFLFPAIIFRVRVHTEQPRFCSLRAVDFAGSQCARQTLGKGTEGEGAGKGEGAGAGRA